MPQTGLSVLMNGGVQSSQTPVSTAMAMSSADAAPSGARQAHIQELIDRDRQASALAAAGMVAESVSLSGKGQLSQGLQAPPPLVAGAAGAAPLAPSTELDSINWNLMDIGAMHLDDMDLDFAQLFDPANEIANMETEGSGWPSTSASGSETGSLPVAPSKPPPTSGNTNSGTQF